MADQGLTGVLLVGGASRRFGAPKALARLGDETLAARVWRTLGECCGERIAVGKRGDGLELPFPIVDDGTDVRAPLAGVVAGLRRASSGVCLFCPVDTPLITAEALLALAAECGDAAIPQTGPLPGAYRKTALPVLERRFAEGRLTLKDGLDELDTHVVELDPAELVNVNTVADLRAVRL